jgi:hypothetical protein
MVKILDKILQTGTIIIDGKEIGYTYFLRQKLASGGYLGYVRAYYDEKNFEEDDHGKGLDHALDLLRKDILVHKSNKDKKAKSSF